MKKVVAIDFDGTLVENNYPAIGKPNTELINWVKLHRNDYTFILWTCRQELLLKNAVDYLQQVFSLTFDYVNENIPEYVSRYGDSRKINADYYIDDRNVELDTLYGI